jgi:ABC-type branched-subunit amino acid transport system substrate-binding protein
VVLATLASLTSVIGAGACSLLLDNSAAQCTSSADCAARGPAFVGTFCSARHACERTCATNEECTAGNGGEPAICRVDQTCASLVSEDCKALVADQEEINDEGTIWMGMLVPLDAPTEILSRAKEDAAELARRDFLVASGGLPPLTFGGPHRHFGFVVCDHTADAARAAHHLVDDVRVPAIIGPIYSGVLIRVATDVTIPGGVLLISPAATSPYITNLANKNGLVWRTAPSDTVQASAISLLMQKTIEPDVRATELKSSDHMRVAVVHKGDAYGLGLADVLSDELVFNGLSVADNHGDYQRIDYGGPSDPANVNPDGAYAHAIDQLVQLAPHVIVIAGTTEGITKILAPLEERWTAAFRPRYVMTDGAHPRPELFAAVGTDSALRKRILGTVPGTNSDLYQKFLGRYASVFHDGTEAIQTTAATYDAAYLLAYAIASLGAQSITGATINEGLKRMVPPGPSIDVGPDAINRALKTLSSPGNIDFNGASGPLDFDVTTGEAEADVQVWCLGADAMGQAVSFRDSGLFYSAKTKSLQGTLACP